MSSTSRLSSVSPSGSDTLAKPRDSSVGLTKASQFKTVTAASMAASNKSNRYKVRMAVSHIVQSFRGHSPEPHLTPSGVPRGLLAPSGRRCTPHRAV